jgi:hypothetical protein
MNQKLLSGPFQNRVVEEGASILDVPFRDLSHDLQQAIVEYWEDRYNRIVDLDDREDLALAQNSFEGLWDSEETDNPIDLLPLSQTTK